MSALSVIVDPPAPPLPRKPEKPSMPLTSKERSRSASVKPYAACDRSRSDDGARLRMPSGSSDATSCPRA